MSSNHEVQKILFGAASRLTVRHARAGARFLDWLLLPSASSFLMFAHCARRSRRVLLGASAFRRFLVIPDIHIGDAVMTQAALAALRDFYPEAKIDYVVNRTAFPLIEGNPDATRVLPVFSGGAYPSEENLGALRDLIVREHYDLCVNHSPFITNRVLSMNGERMLSFLCRTPMLIFNERHPRAANHFLYQMYRFTHDELARVARPVRKRRFRGVSLHLSDAAVDRARGFAVEAGLNFDRPVIFHNPDAAFDLTRMPFDKQARFLARLAEMDVRILLGEGHTAAGIGKLLKAALPGGAAAKVRIIPAGLPLEAYAALVDFSDVFISADTGPLHIAAARKISRSGRFAFRNHAAILSVFGATPARMSGYDSFQPGFLPANQDAPSWTYVSESPCRNITCLDKMFKVCPETRCFEGMDADALAGLVGNYLRQRERMPTLHKEPDAV